MPIGSYAAVPAVASALILRQPKSVLDLGMGFGMNGAMVRQWVDLGVSRNTYLAGVEVWGSYRSPLWELYDIIYVQTIEEYLRNRSETFDAVLLGDVIEHFERHAGEQVLEQAKAALSPGGTLIVATPHGEMIQGPAHGNPYETHRSSWYPEDFTSRGFRLLMSGADPQLPPAVATIVAEYVAM